jgi:hypothetical protein
MKTRNVSRIKDLVLPSFYSQQFNNGPVSSSSSTAITRLTDVVVGEGNPRYKKQIALGLNATTNLSATRYFSEPSPGGATAVYSLNNGNTVYTESLFGFQPSLGLEPTHFSVPDSDLFRVEQQALKRFYAAVRLAQRQISGPTFLGELKETVGMLRRPLVSLDRLFTKYLTHKSFVFQRRRYARRTVRNGREIARDLVDVATDLWLEYSLGIKPLLNDTEDIARSVARLVNEIRHTVVRGYATDTFAYSTASPYTRANYFRGWVQRRDYQQYECIYRGGIRASVYDAPFGFLSNLQRIIGFDASTFIPTLWELIPYSFVVDYFVNVGDVLEAANTDKSAISWMSKTTRRTTSSFRKADLESSNASALVSWTGDSDYGAIGTVIRTVNRTKTIPLAESLELAFTLPGYASQAANILALILSRTRVS